jgi:tetratricopeptide (TPR) repeat protein
METITAQPFEVNQIVGFNEGGFNSLRAYVNDKILPLVENLKEEYDLLGLQVPFNQRLIEELLTTGTEKTGERLEAMVKHDLKGKHSIIINNALAQIDSCMQSFEAALDSFKQAIRMCASIYSYKINANDLIINNDVIQLNEVALKDKFTTKISNQKQLMLFNKAYQLAQKNNEIVDFLNELEIPVPMMGLFGTLLRRINNTDRLEVNTDALKSIQ